MMSMIDFSEVELVEKPTPKKCKGQIYRYVRDAWLGSDGDVNFRHRFRWIKSLSCAEEECGQCGWLYDDFMEQLNLLDYYIDFESMLPCYLKPKQLYQLKVIDWSTDWETGICDDWTIGFEEWNEEDIDKVT